MRKQVGSMALLAAMGMFAAATVAEAQIPVQKDRAGTVQNTSSTTGWTNNETGRTVMVSTGDIEMYSGLTDANIVAHIITGDSLEVEMSRLALSRASSQAVRDFAQTLIDHHSKNRTEFIAMQKDEDIGIVPPPSDPLAQHAMMAMNELRNLSGSAFDRAFIRHQVMHHDADAAALQRMADVARDDDLEQDIEEKTLPVIRQHLARARDLASQLGVDVSMYNMTRTTP